jgi:hypothetical protein
VVIILESHSGGEGVPGTVVAPGIEYAYKSFSKFFSVLPIKLWDNSLKKSMAVSFHIVPFHNSCPSPVPLCITCAVVEMALNKIINRTKKLEIHYVR